MLKRSLGKFALLFAAVGGIVGSGWLFGPYYAAQFAGPAALLAWILGGALMMIVALTFAELSSTFPMPGGTVRFLQLSHGPLVSFSMAWILWISSLAVAPIETLALLHYASNYLPSLMKKVHGAHVLTTTGLIVAAIILFIICCINSIGVKTLAKTNMLVVGLKLIVPIFTVVILLILDFHPHNFNLHGFAPFGFKGILTALPAAGVIFSFIGYSPAIQLAGEARDPQKSIPFAIIGALIICILLYLLLQIAFIGALNPTSMNHGWSHLNFKGDSGPFAGIAIGIGAAWLAKILFIDAALSPFGTALIYTASTARMCYAMGENGYLPTGLMKLNRHSVPARIIILNFVIGLFLFLPFPTWQNMMSFLVSSLVFAYAVGPLSLIVLRKILPNQQRPFRVPCAYGFCLLAFYICNLIVFWTGWHIVYKMLIAIAIGYIILLGYQKTKSGIHLKLEWAKSWWIFFYIAITGCLSYLGSFGGGQGIIPFGWDFIVIAIISWVIFELARRCALETAPLEKLSDSVAPN